MRKFLLPLIALFLIAAVFAVPARPGTFTVEQPDGSTFEIHQFGDERGAWAETPAGHTVIQDEDGWWMYAQEINGQLIASSAKVGKDSPPRAALNLGKEFVPETIESCSGNLEPKSSSQISEPSRAPITSAGDLLVILVEFTDQKAERDPAATHSGSYEWYSNSSNNLNNNLTQEFNFTNISSANLTFWTFYEIENNTDYGYVEVSTDGSNWTQEANYTGAQDSWTQESIDLSAYDNESTVYIRFRYETDNATAERGWFIDDFAISEISFSDTAETDGDWTADGWYRATKADHEIVYDANYYDNLLFNESNNGSMWAYYDEVSYSQFNLTGSVAGTTWYTSSHTMSYYGKDGGTCGGTIDSKNGCIFELAREALELADDDIDYSAYDDDSNNIIDSDELTIVVVHAGCGQEDGSCSLTDEIWSHKWTIYGSGYGYSNTVLDSVELSKRNSNATYTDVGDYNMLAEDSPVGTFAHEFGHSLGLPDLYATTGGATRVGDWDIMDHGSWNGPGDDGSSPAHFSAWSKYFLGWTDPIIVDSGTVDATFNQSEDSGDTIYMLLNSTYNESGNIPNSNGEEYFLAENRQKVGFDSYLPGAGLLIWHIDDSVGTITSNNINNDNAHKRVDLESADGTDPSTNYGDAGDTWKSSANGFSATSTPNSNLYSGGSSGASIENISASGASMTATLSIDNPPSVTVLHPNGGERLEGTITVNATATDTDGQADIQNVSFYRSTDGSAWTLIGTDTTASGTTYSVSWNTAAVADGATYQVKAIATDNSSLTGQDTSDAVFAVDNINDDPSITLDEPDGGETWDGTETIQWAATDANEDNITIDIKYSANSGSTWTNIATDEENDGSYSWDTEDVNDGSTYKIRVVAEDEHGETDTATSGTFSISNEGGGAGASGGVTGDDSGWTKITYDAISANEKKTWNLPVSSGLAVVSIELKVKTAVSAAKIKIKKLDSKPTSISTAPSGKVYQYFQIETENLPAASISSVDFKFKLPRSWYSTNNADENTLSLKRWSGGGWTNLETTTYKSDSLNNFYSAPSAGFSYFAISAQSKSGDGGIGQPMLTATGNASATQPTGGLGIQAPQPRAITAGFNTAKIVKFFKEQTFGLDNGYWVLIFVGISSLFILLLFGARVKQKPSRRKPKQRKIKSRSRPAPRPFRPGTTRWRMNRPPRPPASYSGTYSEKTQQIRPAAYFSPRRQGRR